MGHTRKTQNKQWIYGRNGSQPTPKYHQKRNNLNSATYRKNNGEIKTEIQEEPKQKPEKAKHIYTNTTRPTVHQENVTSTTHHTIKPANTKMVN